MEKVLTKNERLGNVTKPMPTEFPVIMELLSNDNINKDVYIKGDNGEKFYIQLKENRKISPKATITSKSNRQETIRFISGIPTIFVDEQKKLYNIEANYKSTYEDNNSLKFVEGQLIIDDETLLEYVWNHPSHNLYQGRREGGVTALFRVQDNQAKSISDVSANKIKRVMLNKIAEITDEDNGFENMDELHIYGLLYRVFGSSFQVLENKNDICLQLQSLANSAETKEDLAYISLLETTKDELLTNTDVIVGYALKQGVLSLTHNIQEISIKNNKGDYETAYITGSNFSDYYDKVPLFIQHLNSAAGLTLLNILKEKILPETEKKKLEP